MKCWKVQQVVSVQMVTTLVTEAQRKMGMMLCVKVTLLEQVLVRVF